MQDNSTLKVAIIRLSSLGDIIVALVFLDLLKGKFARRNIEISWIVDSQFRGILENSPLVDKIIDLPLRQSKKNKRLIFSAIKKVRNLGHFDKVIDSQGLLKSALIGKMLKKSEFIGYDKDSIREKIASFFYTKKAQIAYNEHILKRQYELFKAAFDGVDWESDFRLEMLDSRNHTIDSSKRAKVKIAEIITPHKANKKILFLCETSKADREFSLDSFYALAEGLWSEYENATIFLIWDKKESEIRALGAKDSRFCVLPHLNLDEIKALLARVDLVIGGDTGITHSAWAMRVPSVTIYVSTEIERFALGGENHFSISGGGNLSLGLHSADFANLEHCADSSPALRPKFAKSHESQTENPSVVDSAISQNLNKNNPCEAPENSPASWCKKSGEASSSGKADFLLEADKRGSPPKSEKAVAFWEHNKKELGGAGIGVQPFLREESSELSGEGFAESIRDFSPTAQNDKIMDCNADSANLLAMTENKDFAESALDSADSAIIAQIIKFTKKALV